MATAPSSSGCAKAVIVAVVIIGTLFIGGMVALAVGANWVGKKANDAFGTKSCPFLSDAAAQDLFGAGARAQQLGKFFDAMTGVIQDNRAIADAPSCFITTDKSGGFARVARLTTGDASGRFAAERQAAQPTKQDQGNGLSLESSGWFGNDVTGLGDEAFCTAVTGYGSVGVLVRRGDTLVYASVLDTSFDPSQLGTNTSTGTLTDDTTCAKAQELARKVLG